MNYKEFIGIDISKVKLDVHYAISNSYEEVVNKKDAIQKLLDTILFKFSHDKVVILCEATGGYERDLRIACNERGVTLLVAQPKQVRAFAKAIGIIAKTDKIDAKVLAMFCQMMSNKLNPSTYHPAHEELRALIRRRNELVARKVTIANHLELETSSTPSCRSCNRELAFIAELIKEIEKDITTFFHDPDHLNLKQQYCLLTSIPGIGVKVASEIIAELPEIQDLTANKLSALCGLAPMNKDSGNYKGKRVIQGGRKNIRKCLYMSALTAIRYDNTLKKVYDRLRQNGKAFKVAMTAIIRKLLLMAQAVLKRGSPWKPFLNTTLFSLDS
jgi:transposase